MQLSTLPSKMTQAQFIAAFADIFEDTPWVAEQLWEQGVGSQHDTPEALAAAMSALVEAADADKQLALIMAHPVLGSKKKMGAYSVGEQKQANLSGLSDEQAQYLQQLNDDYMQKFNIPFIMAVKGATPETIINAMQQRLQSPSAADEQRRALDEIYKIAAFRLQALWQ